MLAVSVHVRGGKWATPQDSMCVLFRAAWKALYAGLFLQLCKLYRRAPHACKKSPHRHIELSRFSRMGFELLFGSHPRSGCVPPPTLLA